MKYAFHERLNVPIEHTDYTENTVWAENFHAISLFVYLGSVAADIRLAAPPAIWDLARL